MEQRRSQIFDRSLNRDSLRVPILDVRSCVAAVENGDRRIDAAAKSFSVDAINEVCAIPNGALIRLQLLKFRDKLGRNYVIGIERKHPRR